MASARDDLMTCNCLREISIARKILLLDHHGMAQAPRRIAKLGHAKAPIAAVDTQQRHALEAKLGEDVPGQGQALHAVVLEIGEVPRDVGFGDGGVGGGRVDDGDFSAQCHAQCDMRGFGTDGAEDRPVLIVVHHLDHFIRRRAPDCWVGGTVVAVNGLGLPVVVVVVLA